MTATPPPLVSVRGLEVTYRTTDGALSAVAGVNLVLHEGETLGLIGESGCGKSTVARVLARVEVPTEGTVAVAGTDVDLLTAKELRRFRTGVQILFPHPSAALNPRRTIAQIVAEPFTIWHWGNDAQRTDRIRAIFDEVGLDYDTLAERRPAQCSVIECLRVGLARALLLEPQILICDEILTDLDVTAQANILNLLHDLKERHHLSVVFVGRHLAAVQHISDRIAVMYLGKIVEVGRGEDLLSSPAHHYTAALAESARSLEPEGSPGTGLAGEPPSALNPPSGCRFRTRCPRAEETCVALDPPLVAIGPGRQVACHFPLLTP